MSAFDLLHALRIRGAVEDHALAPLGGPGVLPELMSGGLVAARDVRGRNYLTLTPEGLTAHDVLLRDRSPAGALSRLGELYDTRFVPVNADFKALCAEWQQTSEQWELLEPLGAIDTTIGEILVQAGGEFPHLGGYRPRLEQAYERVVTGDSDALVAALGDSYHNIWFQLHEDLLITLGRSRTDEDA